MSLILGEFSYGTIGIINFDYEDCPIVRTGKFCSFAGGISMLLNANHRSDTISTYPFKEFGWRNAINNNRYSKKVPSIGNDVWIGCNVTILSGASIGDGAIIGANTTVTKDVPPYSIVCGNPGVVKKYRFTPEQITELLKYPWWNLQKTQIEDHIIPIMDNIDAVILKLKEIYA